MPCRTSEPLMCRQVPLYVRQSGIWQASRGGGVTGEWRGNGVLTMCPVTSCSYTYTHTFVQAESTAYVALNGPG